MIRLLCTFTLENNIQNTVDTILSNYNILNGKIFILKLLEKEELACTYNIDGANLNTLIDNTISIHRHKETNTLYTINGLNYLIKTLNNEMDRNYKVNWEDYRNSAIIVSEKELVIYKLEIFDILKIN